MVNIDNLLKVKNKKICILLKYGDYMSVSGILLRIEANDIVLDCKDNTRYGDAKVLGSEAYVPISSLAVWFLIKENP